MTLATMIDAIRARVNDTGKRAYTDAEITAYLNEAQMAVVAGDAPDAAIPSLTAIWSGVWVNGTYDYALPADWLHERYVEINGFLAIRVPLLELEALRANALQAPTITKPRYAIANGLLRFYTGAADPSSPVFTVWYTRKPMFVKTATTATRTTNVVTLNFAAHGLGPTPANVGDTIIVEGVTPAGATSFNGTFVIASIPGATSLTYASSAANDTGTGGRMIHSSLGQIVTGGSPVVPAIFHSILMDLAVRRCREQGRQFGEAQRQGEHAKQKLEAIKSRYGGGVPHDGLAGDPGRRTMQGGG